MQMQLWSRPYFNKFESFVIVGVIWRNKTCVIVTVLDNFFPELVNKLHSLTAEKEESDGRRKFMKRISALITSVFTLCWGNLLNVSVENCENSKSSSDGVPKNSHHCEPVVAALYLGQWESRFPTLWDLDHRDFSWYSWYSWCGAVDTTLQNILFEAKPKRRQLKREVSSHRSCSGLLQSKVFNTF